ncbi:hypothetical protein ACVJGD_001567 [Bradyrhizobium sp. USDA 10063]
MTVLRGGGELRLHLGELRLDDRLYAGARAQDVEIVGDLGRELGEFLADLVTAERGQALQAEIEDFSRLLQRKADGAVRVDPVARIVDQREHVLDVPRRPVARHQGFARGRRIRRGADHADDLVDIGNGDGQTDLEVGAVARFAEQIFGSPGHHLFAEGDEDGQQILQVHLLRAAGIERQDVGREVGLQRREAVELIQHHVRHRLALQFDHDAETFAVGLVAQVGNTLDLLLADELADPLDHVRLVNLVRDLRDDDRLAILAQGVDRDLAAHHDRAAAEMIG